MPAPELPQAWPLVQVQAQGLLQPRVVSGLEPAEATEPRPPGQEPMAQRAAPQGQPALAVVPEQRVLRKEVAAAQQVPRQEAASAQQPEALEARAQWPAIKERGRDC